MKKVKYLIYLMLVCVPVYSTILMRNTFEEYEGTSFPQMGWSISSGGNGILEIYGEDPGNSYQSQAHGKWSMHIYDPDNNSYANAYKTFTNSSSEYMTEFYMWIPADHTTIDSFPLCVLWNVVIPETLRAAYKTDIALVLDTVDVPPNGHPFKINVEDAAGMQFATYIDSTDRWYKIQIYRHDGVIDLYLDGDSIGTYSPMHSNYVTNKIVLGTTAADSLANGEVFYDDMIVSTPPLGEHPRLLGDSTYFATIKNRAYDKNDTPLGISYYDVYEPIKDHAYAYADSDSFIVVGQDTFYHPFPYPAYSCTSSNMNKWNFLCGQIKMRLIRLSLAYLVEEDVLLKNTALEILRSLATWIQWANPYLEHDEYNQYCFHAIKNLTTGFSFCYDLMDSSLNNYDRISLQNALLALGINQLYLESLYGRLGSNLQQGVDYDGGDWPNYYIYYNANLGFGSLLLKSEFTGEFPN